MKPETLKTECSGETTTDLISPRTAIHRTVAGRNMRSTYDSEGASAAARQHSHTLLRSS